MEQKGNYSPIVKYLSKKNERRNAILNGESPDLKRFAFKHQDISDVEDFRKTGVVENLVQWNGRAAAYVRKHRREIEAAAKEFGIDPNIVKAVIFTEEARGGYERDVPFGRQMADSKLPGNIKQEWATLIPGADLTNRKDNLRVAAKLWSEIAKRLDDPHPEDVYALYNSMAHDKTYVNDETKTTPYFMKRALEEKAWEYLDWSLDVRPEDIQRRRDRRIAANPSRANGSQEANNPMGGLPPVYPKNRYHPNNRAPKPAVAKPDAPRPNRMRIPDRGARASDAWATRDHTVDAPNVRRLTKPFVGPAVDAMSKSRAESRKAEIERMMREDRRRYFKDETVQEEYRRILEKLAGPQWT